MRAKFTIAVCALLMLGLAATQVHAQGFNVSKSETDVVEGGRNQMLGAVRLDYTQTGGNIDDGRTIKVTYGSLELTGGGELLCAGTFNNSATEETAETDCITGVEASFANDDDTNIGTVTISLGTTRPDGSQFGFVVLRAVRGDVSGLSVGDGIVAAINSSTAPTGFVPIGQDRTESVGGTVSTVMDGLDVEVGQASRLLCNIGEIGEGDDATPVGGVPSITVSEGVATAWETVMGGTMITIKMNSLPEGVNLRWPHVVNFVNPADDNDDVWSMLTLTDGSRRSAGMVDTDTTMGAGQEDNPDTTGTDEQDDVYAANNGAMVTYMYGTTNDGTVELSQTVTKNVTTEKDSFKIEFDVDVADLEKVGAGGISDIWAWLAPAGKSGDDDNRGTVLSYVMETTVDTDPDVVMGDIINFGECVTYLLFPYVTCSNTDEQGAMVDPWTTAMAIANTTMDDGVFGISAGAAAQNGDITLHTFPRSMMGDDGMMMMMDMDPMTVAADLAAGDTWSDTCSNILPGFNGYIIAKAGFRHAHGVAFVLRQTPGGAAPEVAHGYLGLVIPDPEFDNKGRGAAGGESLGQ